MQITKQVLNYGYAILPLPLDRLYKADFVLPNKAAESVLITGKSLESATNS